MKFKFAGVVVALFGLAACQSPSYFNIPAVGHELANNNPNALNPKANYVISLNKAYEDMPADAEQVTFLLPDGSTWETYTDIAEKLNEVFEFVNSHRDVISNGVALKIIRFLKDVDESIENTVGLIRVSNDVVNHPSHAHLFCGRLSRNSSKSGRTRLFRSMRT